MELTAPRVLRFISEMKRRRVFKVAVAYVVVAWVAIEVADTTFPLLQLPEWGAAMVVGLVIVGFPLALVLSWGYDVTSAGVVRTGAVDDSAAPVSLLPTMSSGSPIPSSEIVGREREVREATALLRRHRIVTLTGPGGIGKTRLALEVLRRMDDGRPEDSWVVELAGLQDRELVVSAVAQTLGVRLLPDRSALDTLAAVISDRHGLLLLDNCEHLISATASVAADLIGRCPHLHILATSREALKIDGERKYPLGTLPASVPGPDGSSLDGDAMRLFAERAREVLPGFRITAANRGAVSAICERVDGLPLALELAAARLQVLSSGEIAERLERSFDLLSGGRRDLPDRHQAMDAVIQWSVDLLTSAERKLFTELSVFRGGFELDALEPILNGNPDTLLDRVASLVDRSLIAVDGSADPRRFRLLEAIRQFGWSRLEADAGRRLQLRHLAWSADLAEIADARLTGPDASSWLQRLDQERDNLRAAMGFALEQERQVDALRIAGGLSWFWFRRGYAAEARLWLGRVLDTSSAVVHPSLPRVLLGLAGIDYLDGDLAAASAHLDRAIELSDQVGAGRIRARSLVTAAYIRAASGDLDAAQRMAREGRELARAEGHRDVETEAFTALGQIARAQGRLEESEALLLKGVAGAHEIGHRWQESSASWMLAKVALDRGDSRTAADRVKLCIRLMWSEGDRTSTLVGLHTLAAASAGLGDPERAAILLGAVASAGERIGYSPERMDPQDASRTVARVRKGLDPASFQQALEEGRRLSLDDAVAMAV